MPHMAVHWAVLLSDCLQHAGNIHMEYGILGGSDLDQSGKVFGKADDETDDAGFLSVYREW